jgi:hypothetical protein
MELHREGVAYPVLRELYEAELALHPLYRWAAVRRAAATARGWDCPGGVPKDVCGARPRQCRTSGRPPSWPTSAWRPPRNAARTSRATSPAIAPPGLSAMAPEASSNRRRSIGWQGGRWVAPAAKTAQK